MADQRDFRVDWRLISLRILNENKNYEKFPPGYETMHAKGTAMLRVAAAARKEHGEVVLGDLYTAFGESIWDRSLPDDANSQKDAMAPIATPEHIAEILAKVDLPESLAAAAEDSSLDAILREETELALSRTGRDVGTPIITYQPPDGPSFFGPVISVAPEGKEALELWDAVLTLAQWPSFAEIKRTLRETPRLKLLQSLRD